MIINDVEVRQAENNEVTVGTVSEFDIKVYECTRECEIDGAPKKINSAWIGGSMIVEVNGNPVKHSFRYLDTIRHKKNGDENKVFKGIMTALGYDVEFDTSAKKLTYNKINDGLIPKIEGKITFIDINKNTTNTETVRKSGEPTRVKVTSKLSLQEGLNRDQSDLAFYNELPVSYISTSGVSDEDSARFTVEGVIKDIVDEFDSNGSTTGRYIIDLVVPNYFGVDVFNLIMLDKWTNVIDGEDVEITKDMFYTPNSDDSFCKLGDTVKLSGDIEGHSFGAVQTVSTAKKTFGGGAKSVKSGFTRIEWTVKAGDIIEDADQYDTEIIKKALEEREIILDNNYKKRLEDYKNSQSGKDNAPKTPVKGSANGGNSPFGKPANNPFGGAKKSPF